VSATVFRKQNKHALSPRIALALGKSIPISKRKIMIERKRGIQMVFRTHHVDRVLLNTKKPQPSQISKNGGVNSLLLRPMCSSQTFADASCGVLSVAPYHNTGMKVFLEPKQATMKDSLLKQGCPSGA